MRFFEGRGARTLADVTAADVAAYYRFLARRANYRRADAGPLHAATREHLARAVRTLFAVAVECGWVGADASSGVGRGVYAGGARAERRAMQNNAIDIYQQYYASDSTDVVAEVRNHATLFEKPCLDCYGKSGPGSCNTYPR